MSGDGGVRAAVAGAVMALAADETLHLDLVGQADQLDAALTENRASGSNRLAVVACDTVLPMDAGTAHALRHGRNSSMQVVLERVAQGQAAAAVSSGNTGALMALSRQLMGMLPGVERPALMAAVPGLDQAVWMLDLGANINVDAHRLLEFAQLGSIAVEVIELRQPRIGLLNIGHEPNKGPDVLREAARLIGNDDSLDYHGFVEANAVFEGVVDLVVCDGFAGNVLLKGTEGVSRLVVSEFSRAMGKGLAGLLARRHLRRLHDRLDPARHNGAPLLGIRGTVIKSHGNACQRGFASAIALAALEARRNLIPELEHKLWASF